MPKRVVFISDKHCGHRSGLTPPEWQWKLKSRDPIKRKFAEVQIRMWEFYSTTLAALQPIDTLVVNGDSIDGKADRSGSTELITADREEQVRMAAECIREARAKNVYVIAGTPYHTGRDEDWEEVLAKYVGAKRFGLHEFFSAEGVTFDVRHKTSSSVIPHGRFTGPRRAALWNSLKAERGLQPKAQIIIRSHVHFYGFSGDANSLVMTTPALQAWTKYGSTQCEGTTDIGLVSFDLHGKGAYSWNAHLLDMQWAAERPLEL